MTRAIDDRSYREHAQHVWAIAYRMTGSASDADDLVQETFVRAMNAPRAHELRPWLTRIATNASIDALRARKRVEYAGPWLPEPIDTGDACAEDGPTRYDLLESATVAFLIALEALSPRARAVLLLRDVFDYSVKETADVLSMTQTHVKVTHHRARKVMERYDAAPSKPTRELQAKTLGALGAFVTALSTGDAKKVEALLAHDVRTENDGAGEFHAARKPVIGSAKVALFWTKVRPSDGVRVEMRMLNGLPSLIVMLDAPREHIAPRSVLTLQVGRDGRIRALHSVVARGKLARLLDLE